MLQIKNILFYLCNSINSFNGFRYGTTTTNIHTMGEKL